MFFGFISNFGELPIGTVCVADVQFKGRGVKHYLINFLCLLLACNLEIIIIEQAPHLFLKVCPIF